LNWTERYRQDTGEVASAPPATTVSIEAPFWDIYKQIAAIAPEDAAKPLEASECQL
jgi:predicted DNA-binding ribbon-helix-helix protein